MKLPIHNINGELVGKAEASDAVFGVELNPDLLHQALVYHQANQRQGTSNTLTRSTVSGGGAKPFSQKGTGRARQGTTRAPHMRHGGRAFGPHPRSYRKQLPRRMRRGAIRGALSAKIAAEAFRVVKDLDAVEGKTKALANALEALGISGSALVVTSDVKPALTRAVRNIPRTKFLSADLLNVLDLMRYRTLIISPEAIDRAGQLWADDTRKKAQGGNPVKEEAVDKA